MSNTLTMIAIIIPGTWHTFSGRAHIRLAAQTFRVRVRIVAAHDEVVEWCQSLST